MKIKRNYRKVISDIKSNIAKGQILKGGLVEYLNSNIIQVIGDSTGNETTEWVYLLAQKIASAYPTHNVKYKLYDQPNAKYSAWVDIQHYGEDRHMVVANVTNGDTNLIDNVVVVKTSPTGDLDLRMLVALDDWQQADNPYLFSKWEGIGHYCFALRLIGNKINLVWSADGTNLITKATDIDTTSWVDGEAHWLRVTLDVDNGASGNTVTGYTSTDGVTWITGTPVITAGVTSVFEDATANYRVGSRDTGAGKALGKYYEVSFHDGINGANILPQTIEAFRSPTGNTFACSFGGTPTVYIFNASVSGSGMTQWNDGTYVKNAIPITFGALLFLSLGHNDSNQWGASYLAKWDNFLSLVRARTIGANEILVTQNPIASPQLYVFDRSLRRKMLMGWAKSKNISTIDTYQAFVRDSRGLSVLLNADMLHPAPAGSSLWVDTVWDDLNLK